MLRFVHSHTETKLTRGLTADALETFHGAFIGSMEFGHYFRIAPDLWRWGVLLPITDETSGICASESEARARLMECYKILLETARLVPIGVP